MGCSRTRHSKCSLAGLISSYHTYFRWDIQQCGICFSIPLLLRIFSLPCSVEGPRPFWKSASSGLCCSVRSLCCSWFGHLWEHLNGKTRWRVFHGRSTRFCLSRGYDLCCRAAWNLISRVLSFRLCIFSKVIEKFSFKMVSRLFYRKEIALHIWAICAWANLTFWICRVQGLQILVF